MAKNILFVMSLKIDVQIIHLLDVQAKSPLLIDSKVSAMPLDRPVLVRKFLELYLGQQNDFILLSLVRTKTVGHIRDVRRLIVAMSRARLGLYIFGRIGKISENIYDF